ARLFSVTRFACTRSWPSLAIAWIHYRVGGGGNDASETLAPFDFRASGETRTEVVPKGTALEDRATLAAFAPCYIAIDGEGRVPCDGVERPAPSGKCRRRRSARRPEEFPEGAQRRRRRAIPRGPGSLPASHRGPSRGRGRSVRVRAAAEGFE